MSPPMGEELQCLSQWDAYVWKGHDYSSWSLCACEMPVRQCECSSVWWELVLTTLLPLAASRLIILFSEMLKFSNFNFQESKLCQGKYRILQNILFFEMEISKLINHSTNMCTSCQGTMVLTQVLNHTFTNLITRVSSLYQLVLGGYLLWLIRTVGSSFGSKYPNLNLFKVSKPQNNRNQGSLR